MEGRGRPKGSGVKKVEAKRELPSSIEELNKATGGLKPFARPVVRAYDALMQFVSDEALDEEEKQMGADAVAALLWYYGISHPITLTLIFVGGTTARRAPAIVKKARARRAANQAQGATLRALPQAPAQPVAHAEPKQ